jgi:hypothetical protein
MKKYNKIEKTFGPMAFAGKIMFFVLCVPIFGGIIGVVNSFSVYNMKEAMAMVVIILLFFIGAFTGFTATYSYIDLKNKRIKYSTQLFGIIPIGKWTYLTSDMKLGLKKSTDNWGAYSQSNRSTSLSYSDLKIMLYDAEDTEIIPVKKVKKAKNAESELEKLSKLLNLEIIK